MWREFCRVKLVKPSIAFKDSFIEAAIQITGEGHSSFLKGFNPHSDFQAYCDKLNNEAKGIGLADGIVPSTYFWLIDNDCFIGEVGSSPYIK